MTTKSNRTLIFSAVLSILFMVALPISVDAQIQIIPDTSTGICQEQLPIVTSQIKDTSVLLTWTTPTYCHISDVLHPTHYIVQTPFGEFIQTNDLSMLIEGLEPNTTYGFAVIAVYNDAMRGLTPVVFTTLLNSPLVIEQEEESNGGCNDCTPPTLGLNSAGAQLVENGFSYNGNPTDVEYFFTPYPLLTVNVGAPNIAEFKVYENSGPGNVRHFEFVFGLDKGQIINDSKAAIIWDMSWEGIETVSLIDPNNALEDVSVYTEQVKCAADSNNASCLLITIEHTFREPLGFNIVGTLVWDDSLNSWQNYYNHGIEVVGDSLNPAEEYSGNHNRQVYHLTETDKNSAVDEFGDSWTLKFSKWTKDYVKPTPIIDEATDVMTRSHSSFSQLQLEQVSLASIEMFKICPSCLLPAFYGFEDSFGYDYPERADNRG